ncbi:hypothetical protein Aple_077460 [Acrocarpospora pleiomorpha]|uniref:Uncharacterized protein n=1 Tax=Acrocarpospora pleiomorpha TaxID=90975 RepID=A0A5M3XUI5_9ACTN|nr:hypothetical protein Aple_077460 [Acrocarpospora pleiomorpha]
MWVSPAGQETDASRSSSWGRTPGTGKEGFAVIRSHLRVQPEDPGEPAGEPEEETADPDESEDPDQPSDPRPSTWIGTVPPSMTRTTHTMSETRTIHTTPVTGTIYAALAARTTHTALVTRTGFDPV